MLLFYLPKAIKKERPGVIIANIYDLLGMIPALLFPRVKLVVDIRSSFGTVKGIRGHIGKITYHMSIKLAKYLCDGITVTSSALKEEVCTNYNLDPAKVGVVTNGVSLDIFDYEKNIASSEKLRERLRMSNRFIVLYHGSIGIKRGLQETVEAMARVAAKHPEILLFVLGTGPVQFMDKLKSLVAKKHLENNVHIHRPVIHQEVPRFILMCDVGILPADNDSFPRTSCPLKLLEYLAMRKPVIGTDIPFTEEILRYGHCVVLMSSNKPQNIASAIGHTYENRAFLEQMGKIGRAIVEQHYSWEKKAKDLEDFIGRISK